jgi:tetratricopeptide (TPR) repeat protein
MKLLERALAVHAADRAAAEQLVKTYLRTQRLSNLPAVFEGLVANAADDGEATRRLLEFEPHVLASGGADTWLDLAEPFLAKKGAAQGELAFARARVLASDPARADRAAREFRDLIGTAKGQAGRLIDAFDAFLAKSPPTERREDRRFVYAWKADHAPEGQQTSALLAWAQAEESTFGDPKAAAAVYERVLAIEPERGDALEAMVRLLRQMGDTEGALAALIALRDSSEGPSRRERDLEIADMLLTALDRPLDALARVEPLIEAGPTDPGALGLVYRALENPRSQEHAAELLERAASLAEDQGQAVVILRALLAMPKVPALHDARRRWFESLLDHYESDPKVALETVLAAVTENPGEEQLWARAEKLARSLEQPALVADVYRRVLEQELDAELAATVGRRAVDYREEWFDDPEAVITLLKRVLALSPDSTWARDRLKLAFGSGERWDELFALYDDAIERARTDEERAELLAEAAQAAKDFATDADRAIGYFERLLVLRPGDRRVTSLLERLYEKQGKIQPLIDLLSVELAKLSGEMAQQLRLRIAGLFLRERRHDGSAFKLVEDVLREEPERAEAYTLLEEIVLKAPPEVAVANGTSHGAERASFSPDAEGEGSSIAPGPSEETASVAPPALLAGQVAPSGKGRKKKRTLQVRERAAIVLKDRYVAQNRFSDLARVLEVELSLQPGPKERAKKHQELLTLKLDTLKDDRGAFEHAAALLALEPRVATHRSTLSELAERLSAWERFAEVLVSTAETSNDEPLATRLVVEAAEIYRDHVRRDDRAIDLFASALARAPKDRELALSTARALDALLDRTGRAEERCSVLEKIVALETDPAARRAALSELAGTATSKIGDPDRAIRAWRKYIDEGGTEIESWDGLVAVLRRAQRWAELASALEHHATLADRERARIDLVETARIFGEKLNAPEKAVEAWLDVRRRFGVGDETFPALAQLFESKARWEDLARLVLDEGRVLLEAPLAAGADARLALQRKKAELAVQHVLDRSLAIAVCQQLFDVCVAMWVSPLADDPSSPAAMAWGATAFWALDELVRMALEDRDYGTAVEHMLGGSRYVFDRERARQMRRQAAQVCADRLSDAERAVAVYRELLREDDTDVVADGVVPELARLFGQLGAHADLTDLWEKQAARHAASSRRDLAASLFARAAELAEKKLSDVPRALGAYRKSADQGGQDALREMARLYRNAGEHLKAAEALERLTQARTPDHLAIDNLALASAYLAAGRREQAMETLEKAVANGAAPRAIRARLCELYREERDFGKLAELLRVEAEEADDKATRLALLREAAELHLDERNDPTSAIPLLDQARRLSTDDSSIGLTLTRALVLASRHDEAAGVLRSELERYGSRKPKERAIVHFELARVLLELGERASALAELDLAAKIDPGHAGILCMLGKLAAEEGQLDRAQRTLRALLLVLGRSAPGARVEVSRGEVLFELALIAQKENAAERADELVESALHASSDNPQEAESFERALRKRGSFDLVARSLESRLGSAPSAEVRAAILRDLVLLYEETQKLDAERARLQKLAHQTLRELKGAEPGSPAAWSALETLFEHLGDHDKLGDLLALRVAAGADSSSAEYADVLYRLAQIRLAKGSTIAEGAELLERALDMVPQAERAAAALAPALELAPANERVARLYERVTRGRGREAAHRAALLRLVELGIATAEEMREGVSLALAASNEPLAASILEKLLASDDLEDDQVAWARKTLADLYIKSGNLIGAADLKERAAADATGEERRALLFEVAEAARGILGDLPRAARLYARMREDDPADRHIWEPLLGIYRTLGDIDGLVALTADVLPSIESVDERVRLRLEQAELLLGRPDGQDQAVELLEDVLDDTPFHPTAMRLLSDVLEKRGDKEKLGMLLARQLDAAKDEGDVPTILALSSRLGALLEESGRAADALDVYHASLDWDPHARESLAAIFRLAEGRGDAFEIADALEKLLAVESGPRAAELAHRLYTLRMELGDAELAERALEIGLGASPENRELSELLLQRYQARGAHRELAVLLQQAFDRTPDSAAILFALLDAYRNLGELEAAVEAVTIALDRAPGLAPLYRERAALLEALGRNGEAIADFARAYEVGGTAHLQDFLQALEREAAQGAQGGDRGVRLRLAHLLCETGLTDQARAHLEALLEQNPYDESTLVALSDIEYKAERWETASALLRRLVVVVEGEAVVELALRLADACERAGRAADAQSGLERAQQVAPDNADIRRRLRQIYEKSGSASELGKLILEEAAQETDVAARFTLLLRAADLLLGEEGDPNKAVEVLEEARSLRPDDDGAVLLLGRAYVASGRAPEALELYRAAVAQRKGRRSKQLSAIHREISRIHLGGGDLSSALEALTRAFEMDLQNGEVALELGLLAKDLDDQELAGRAFRSVTFMKAAPPGGDGATPAAKGLSYYFLGRMAKDSGDIRKARLLAQKALIEDPNLEQAKALLEEMKSLP